MKKLIFFRTLFITALMCTPFLTSAQVTIGSSEPPSPFSLLYLDASIEQGGLHLPRLTTAERDALVMSGSDPNDQQLGVGLMIFNTDTRCLEFWNSMAWISFCDGDTPRPNFPDVLPTLGILTAWTNAMYDFQTQRLLIVGGNDNFDSFQWQVSDRADGGWFSIRDETNADFIVPVDFMYNVDGITELAMVKGGTNLDPATVENTRTLYFRRVQTVGETVTATQNFSMYFIRTNTSGFGTDANEVRYLTLNRTATAGGDIRFALLNLGATNDNSLGNFFQWGRRADGHERIVWDKRVNNGLSTIIPMDGIGTSATIARASVAIMGIIHEEGGQVTASDFAGNFITVLGSGIRDWGAGESSLESNRRWGTSTVTVTRHNAPTSISHWIFPDNNPCPAGWRVPNRFELSDIKDGDGSATSNPASANWGIVTASGNTWRWRGYANGAVGGAIVTNQSGEALFLPAAGRRRETVGAPADVTGGQGQYWSSSFQSPNISFTLLFTNSNVQAGGSSAARGFGISVRCVAE